MKDIEGYEGKYAIDKKGRVWSYKKKIYKKNYISNGYKMVCLFKNKKNKNLRISRLLALTYIPNPKNYPIIDHINRNKLDNRLINIRWATSSQNNLNRTKSTNKSSKYMGVSWNKREKIWRVITKRNNKYIYLGRYKNEKYASRVFLNYFKEIYKEYEK